MKNLISFKEFLTLNENDKDCVFCDKTKIEATDIETHTFNGYEFMSFTPLNPISRGHILIVPISHVVDSSSNSKITAAAFGLASELATNKYKYEDYNLISNKGKHADQTVFHLHVHIVPRHENDKTITIWNKQNTHKL